MDELDLHYPSTCPFCTIASAYPPPSPSSSSSSPPKLWSQWNSHSEDLTSSIPSDAASHPEKTSPSSFVVLASADVLAFLDILPMTGGHLLVCTRAHRGKVEDLGAAEARSVGFWLPVLARVVKRVAGTTDYNIVQNNGARAAQVVPHVHFHIIPRPETMPEIKNKSWTMFGRGQRDELDDEMGAKMAAEMRRVLREEVGRIEMKGRKGPKL
ncbi:HIT-like domain-containing protein [Massariosphaeria phaeospora]|uniref:HIT-like domain-containing protein n=1 Tax=Massariosphaeria phaeospora TaxID=100035 RepID=A0A7C8I6Z5_9PLEO|nr:HIT-like domain-containing protein [Massariosphaeria phaeospora]